MARILIAAGDPVFTILLEDHLRLAGHQVELVAGGGSVRARAAESGPDLIILELESPAVTGILRVRGLREQPPTASVPIIALSPHRSSAERLATLRAGADEVLEHPVDLEELLLRSERLLGARETKAPALTGDLATHPAWEVIQYVEQSGKSGELHLQGRSGSGVLSLDRGRAVAARWEGLAGSEALLALLDQQEGRFRFLDNPAAGGEASPPGAPLETRRLVLQAGWLRDELERRRAYLPATGVPLRRLAGAPIPTLDPEDAALPLDAVADRVEAAGSLRLFDLLAASIAAPRKVRLAVAVLVESGVLTVDGGETASYPTTREIEAATLVEVTVGSVLAAAREAGDERSPLPCLILAEPGALDDLRKVLARLHGSSRLEPIRKLLDLLERGRGGSAVLRGPEGALSLHVQTLTAAVARQLQSIIPVCAALLVWLAEEPEPEGLEAVVPHLEGARRITFIAASEAARRRLDTIAAGRPPRISTRPPESLLGLLRLFHPGGRG